MPRNSRNVSAFLGLTAGVLACTSGERRFAGSHPNQSEASIDGITSNKMDSTSSSTEIGPLANFIESYQEIRIDMANNRAEFATMFESPLGDERHQHIQPPQLVQSRHQH